MVIISAVFVNAQNVKHDACESFDVDGLKLGETATQSEVIKRFGKPAKIFRQKNLTYYYYDGKAKYADATSLSFNNDILYYAIITISRIPVLTSIIPGGIRVGDDTEIAKQRILQYTNDNIKVSSDGFCVGGNDDWIQFITQKGKISEIHYGSEP